MILVLAVTATYTVKPLISKSMTNLFWFIKYKLLFDNFRIRTFGDSSPSATTASTITPSEPSAANTEQQNQQQTKQQL